MQGTAALLTPNEMAYALEITPSTLNTLVHNGTIPHTYVQTPDSKNQVLRFNPYLISEWMQTKPPIEDASRLPILDSLRQHYKTQFPDTLKALKKVDTKFAPKREAKGYNLVKVPNKKYGFLYYVRYIRNGDLVHSRWNTRTNDQKAAEQFAVDNRETILAAYDAKHAVHSTNSDLYTILKGYYLEGSQYLDTARQRGRTIGKKTSSVYAHFINKTLIPFLKEHNVSEFTDVTPPILAKLQTRLLEKGNKPQTINRYLNVVSAVFDHLVMDGVIISNVFEVIPALKEKKHQLVRGCYEIDKVQNVFRRKWREELHYLLCLMIYSTGLRNSEIEKIQVQDITSIKNCCFIDVRKSKTDNGVRFVPLHNFVHEKLTAYIRKNNKRAEDYVFSKSGGHNQSTLYNEANLLLGKKLGMTADDLENQHITFYSGRHYYKTLMNAHALGDVEEYFMGHKVSSDVAKRYNHRDKQGQKMILKKAREVFAVLDKTLLR